MATTDGSTASRRRDMQTFVMLCLSDAEEKAIKAAKAALAKAGSKTDLAEFPDESEVELEKELEKGLKKAEMKKIMERFFENTPTKEKLLGKKGTADKPKPVTPAVAPPAASPGLTARALDNDDPTVRIELVLAHGKTLGAAAAVLAALGFEYDAKVWSSSGGSVAAVMPLSKINAMTGLKVQPTPGGFPGEVCLSSLPTHSTLPPGLQTLKTKAGVEFVTIGDSIQESMDYPNHSPSIADGIANDFSEILPDMDLLHRCFGVPTHLLNLYANAAPVIYVIDQNLDLNHPIFQHYNINAWGWNHVTNTVVPWAPHLNRLGHASGVLSALFQIMPHAQVEYIDVHGHSNTGELGLPMGSWLLSLLRSGRIPDDAVITMSFQASFNPPHLFMPTFDAAVAANVAAIDDEIQARNLLFFAASGNKTESYRPNLPGVLQNVCMQNSHFSVRPGSHRLKGKYRLYPDGNYLDHPHAPERYSSIVGDFYDTFSWSQPARIGGGVVGPPPSRPVPDVRGIIGTTLNDIFGGVIELDIGPGGYQWRRNSGENSCATPMVAAMVAVVWEGDLNPNRLQYIQAFRRSPYRVLNIRNLTDRLANDTHNLGDPTGFHFTHASMRESFFNNITEPVDLPQGSSFTPSHRGVHGGDIGTVAYVWTQDGPEPVPVQLSAHRGNADLLSRLLDGIFLVNSQGVCLHPDDMLPGEMYELCTGPHPRLLGGKVESQPKKALAGVGRTEMTDSAQVKRNEMLEEGDPLQKYICNWSKVTTGSKVDRSMSYVAALNASGVFSLADLRGLTNQQLEALPVPVGLKIYFRDTRHAAENCS